MNGNLAILERRKVGYSAQVRERLLARLNDRESDHRAAAAQTGALKLVGYAALFNLKTTIANSFIEIVAPGCFANAIRLDDVRFLLNHGPDHVVARSGSGSLSLREDSKGLAFEALPLGATWVNDLIAAIARGDINQMSYQFTAIRESWDDSGDMPMRTLHEVRLFDISAVTFPATEETTVSVVSSLRSNSSVPFLPAARAAMVVPATPRVSEGKWNPTFPNLSPKFNREIQEKVEALLRQYEAAGTSPAMQARERIRQKLMVRAGAG